MIPLSKILELRKKRSAAVACDAADDTECTKDDPSTCRIHGKKALAETDAEDKSKHSHVNPYGGKPMSVEEAEQHIINLSDVLISPTTERYLRGCDLSEVEKDDVKSAILKTKEDKIDYDESCKTIGETFSYLKAKYPNIEIPRFLAIIVAKPKGELAKGIAPTEIMESVDESTGSEKFILVGSTYNEKNPSTYNHGDFRNTADYIRHEIGHAIAISHGCDGEVFSDWAKDKIGEKKFHEIMQSVSQYARSDRPPGEAIAECFSVYSSPDYDGRLGKEIEGFIKSKMTGEQA